MEKFEETEYSPSAEQMFQLELLQKLVQSCDASDIEIYVLGGYGLDGLYGSLTRDHGDMDILVGDNKLEDFRSLLEKMGFKIDQSGSSKDKYVFMPAEESAANKDFKVEASPISFLEKFLPAESNLDDIISRTPNGHLGDFSFRTLTVKGQKSIAEIQNARAKEGNWGEYKHREHFEKIIDSVEE